MSRLVELRLKGIRAFHPDPPDEERSRIRFDGPVTLITGENGSGKTTIIEALKYATMGQCSRNSKLQEFVNNPKGQKGGCVNAQIELDFDSVDHQMITVSRGAKLTTSDKKKTGMTFKASDCKLEFHKGDEVQTRNLGINEANLEEHNDLTRAFVCHLWNEECDEVVTRYICCENSCCSHCNLHIASDITD